MQNFPRYGTLREKSHVSTFVKKPFLITEVLILIVDILETFPIVFFFSKEDKYSILIVFHFQSVKHSKVVEWFCLEN